MTSPTIGEVVEYLLSKSEQLDAITVILLNNLNKKLHNKESLSFAEIVFIRNVADINAKNFQESP